MIVVSFTGTEMILWSAKYFKTTLFLPDELGGSHSDHVLHCTHCRPWVMALWPGP